MATLRLNSHSFSLLWSISCKNSSKMQWGMDSVVCTLLINIGFNSCIPVIYCAVFDNCEQVRISSSINVIPVWNPANPLLIGLHGYSKNSPLNRCMTQTSVILYWKENGETHFTYLLYLLQSIAFQKKLSLKTKRQKSDSRRWEILFVCLSLTSLPRSPIIVKVHTH
jgi:hypothetical protein